MGREALVAALGWLTISGTLAVNSFVFKDQEGAESASRLYRHVAGAVYASAAPYGAYSFQVPTISAQAAASRVVPVKEGLHLQHANGHLKDSYGNRFVEALQSMKALPFKPFPQQYVQLQELPAHFAQPLAAAPLAQQYKQASPQIVVGSHYRLPLQSPPPTPINQQYSFAHPGVYANTFKNLAPASFSYGPQFGSVIHVPVQSAASSHQDSHRNGPSTQDFSHSVSENQERPTAEQQSTSHKAVYANKQPQENHHLKGEQKFQRLQEAPQQDSFSEEESPAPARQVSHKVTTKHIVSATKETPIPTVVNGKKTIVNVKTKPPLPLLDINLLEPLTFANPLVPQVQHFLPRINEATYHKLPQLEKHEDKKYQKEFVVQKTKTYDSGIIKGKPKNTKKKQKTPEVEHTYHISAATARPTVTVAGPNEAPEFSYEINSPNYKETYKEQAVKYNKETNSEPVHYTYGTNTRKEPVHYSYTHSSKEPVHIQEVRYEGKGEGPKHLIYNFKPEEHNRESEKSKTESNDSGESEHSGDDVPQRPHHHEHKEHHSTHQETPKSNHHYAPEHREQEYHHKPSSGAHHNVQHNEQIYHKPSSESHDNVPHREQEYHHKPSSGAHHNVQHNEQIYHKPSSESHDNVPHREQEYHHKPSSGEHHDVQHKEQIFYHKPSSESHDNVPPREQEYHHKSSSDTHQNGNHRGKEYHHHRQNSDTLTHPNVHHNNHPSKHQPVFHSFEAVPFQHVAQFEEEISLAAPIKVDPNQHVQRGPSESQQPRSSPAPQQHSRPSHTPQQYPNDDDSKPYHETPSTHVREKTKQVYIKEEMPEEEDTVGDELNKSVYGKEEDREKDFENAYKNAAFGFPAYDKSGADVERDISSPESYGVPRDHSSYDIDHSPFQQYQDQSDNFPKEMRQSYKDDRNKIKEDYFLDYSVSKPESLVDRYKNKVNYYKLYKNQKPEKYVAHENDAKNKQKQSAKLTAIPYSYYPVQGDAMKQFFAQYKAAPYASAPLVFEYDYSKGAPTPKDNSAYASRPFQSYKLKTHFVEPQFQYGFEPISIPRLLDSELAAMATNNSPESEKPGTRKKIYKENFYIKKTSLSDAVPNS